MSQKFTLLEDEVMNLLGQQSPYEAQSQISKENWQCRVLSGRCKNIKCRRTKVHHSSYLHKRINCQNRKVRLALSVIYQIQIDKLFELQILCLHTVDNICEQRWNIFAHSHSSNHLFNSIFSFVLHEKIRKGNETKLKPPQITMLQLISPDDTILNPSEFGICMQNHPNNAMSRVQMSYSVQISYINEVKQAQKPQILATPRSRKHSLHHLHSL